MTNPKDHSTRESVDHTTPEWGERARKELERDPEPQQQVNRSGVIERRVRWDIKRGLIAGINGAIDAATRRAYRAILRDLQGNRDA